MANIDQYRSFLWLARRCLFTLVRCSQRFNLHDLDSSHASSNCRLPMVSGTMRPQESEQQWPRTSHSGTRNHTEPQGSMRGFKCRTLGTVFISASLGAAFYYVLFLYVSPHTTSSWILEDGLDTRSQRGLLLTNEEKFEQWGSDRAKLGVILDTEIKRNRWHGRQGKTPQFHFNYYSNCSNTLSGNCSRSNNFVVKRPFHFPQPRFSKSTQELLQSKWVVQLQDYLRTVNGKQVSIVTSSIEHTDILFNWLISAYLVADPPLKNILVLTLDKSLHDLAQNHGFESLYVSPEMVIDPKAKITRVFSQVHIVRLAVVRLMNHYGFDIVNYDCDAILLKNPQTIFDSHKDVDLIGTFGKGPSHLFAKWGVTLNTGVMLLRSSAKLGERFLLLVYTVHTWQSNPLPPQKAHYRNEGWRRFRSILTSWSVSSISILSTVVVLCIPRHHSQLA